MGGTSYSALVLQLSWTLTLRVWPVNSSTDYPYSPRHRPATWRFVSWTVGPSSSVCQIFRLSHITLNILHLALGLIFVLSLVSIIFIWTEYPYLQSKSALVVITPILLAALLLVFSSYDSDSGSYLGLMHTPRFLLPALGERWKFRRIVKQTVLWEAIWTFAVAPFVIGSFPSIFDDLHK